MAAGSWKAGSRKALLKCTCFLIFILNFKAMMSQPLHAAKTDNLYKDVEFFTSLRPYRNYLNKQTLEKCVNYISKELKDAAGNIEIHEFEARGEKYKNVMATFGPQTKERIIIGAHYDVAGNQEGADDNASAVAGLLELARLFKANEPQLKCRYDFVAYCLEEPPFFWTEDMGSFRHAKKMHEEGVDVKLMVCLEMIGYFSEDSGSQSFPVPELKKHYPDKGNFIVVVGREEQKDVVDRFHGLMAKGAKIDVQKIAAPLSLGYIGMSDHSSYWRFNFPAIMINDTSMLRNPNYHRATDTIDTLDFGKMAAVVDGVFNGLVNY
jgi:Zn-dependent M28 family amino/carboxypeptidase